MPPDLTKTEVDRVVADLNHAADAARAAADALSDARRQERAAAQAVARAAREYSGTDPGHAAAGARRSDETALRQQQAQAAVRAASAAHQAAMGQLQSARGRAEALAMNIERQMTAQRQNASGLHRGADKTGYASFQAGARAVDRDAELLQGWLTRLRSALREGASAGVVGSERDLEERVGGAGAYGGGGHASYRSSSRPSYYPPIYNQLQAHPYGRNEYGTQLRERYARSYVSTLDYLSRWPR